MDTSPSTRPLEVQTGGASATTPQSGANEFAFGMLMNRVMGNSSSKRPSDKSANEVQVDIVLNQATGLGKLNEQYVETFVVKGTKALYDLLGAFYSYALQIDQSPLRDNIIQRMAERLLPLLAKGGVFVAVGALHLPGADGLLARLKAAGFSLRALD